ncbi:MAG: LexA family transcriptional regulator [Sphaerochaeta sp.]|nr:LexA family transcriptional regulator [Sphaerochaeta sp.]
MFMIEFWSRVEGLRKAVSLTRKELSAIIAVSQKTVDNWVARNIIPAGDKCLSISSALNTTVEYLLTGNELPLPDDDYVKDEVKPLLTPKGIITQKGEEPTILVPIAPQKISAGRGESFLPSSEYVGYVRILQRMARGIEPERLIAAIVKGDSMTGVQIFSGDVVIFARGYLDENGLYVVSLRGEVLVKRMEFDRIHNQVAIISENKNYRPITVDANDEGVQILGKVVGWVHCHPY